MKRYVSVAGAFSLAFVFGLTGYADSDSMNAPDTDYEDVEEICSELDVEFDEALEYIDEHEIEDAREHVARMVNLSTKLSAYAPAGRHDEFKEQADRLKDKCFELEQAVVGYDERSAWEKISEVRQVCLACHELY